MLKNTSIQNSFIYLLLLLKSHNTRHKVFIDLFPLQDFTSKSDIDWSQSVTDIDCQLYAKYGLTEDEISFMESMIKPM